jgi:hypothetical protein
MPVTSQNMTTLAQARAAVDAQEQAAQEEFADSGQVAQQTLTELQQKIQALVNASNALLS